MEVRPILLRSLLTLLSNIAPLPTGRRAGGAVSVSGKIVVIGGERTPQGGAFSAVEEFDPATNSWRTLPSLPTPRQGFAFGRIGNGSSYLLSDHLPHISSGSPPLGIFIVSGGTTGGASFTDLVHVLRYKWE